MSSRCAAYHAVFRGDRVLAVPTRIGKEGDHLGHLLKRNEPPMMSGVSGLTASLTPTLQRASSQALPAGESIG
jgi:hypothetical protein